jgi:hypothetical protein
MRTHILIIIFLFIFSACSDFKQGFEDGSSAAEIPAPGPIQLHPENPHYFLYKGEPMVLITSAEHYGALLNLDYV